MCKLLWLVFMVQVTYSKIQMIVSKYPIQQIGANFYNQEVLTTNFTLPIELAYDSAARNLYFAYMDDDLRNSGRAFVNIYTKEAVKIKGIVNNKATAIDEDTGEVYFGSTDGLYKYDPVAEEAQKFGTLYDVNIQKLFIRNNKMYYIDGSNHKIYKVFDLGTRAVKVGDWENVLDLHVDFNDNIHFVSMSGVYCVKKGHEIVKNKDLNDIYNFVSDEFSVFGFDYDSLYKIDCENGRAKKIAYLDFFASSIVFGDHGDMFYSADNNIYRLRPINSYHVYNIHRKVNKN